MCRAYPVNFAHFGSLLLGIRNKWAKKVKGLQFVTPVL